MGEGVIIKGVYIEGWVQSFCILWSLEITFTFAYNHFSPKIKLLNGLLSSVAVWWPHGKHRREKFWNLDRQILGKKNFFFYFLKSFMGSFEEKLTSKYLNQPVRRKNLMVTSCRKVLGKMPENNLIWTVSHKSSQLKLRSGFFENNCEGANF